MNRFQRTGSSDTNPNPTPTKQRHPSTLTSPSKKKANGYTTAISFNIHNIVQLSDEPATGDDCFYGADDDSSDDVFV
ncbi:hypothetical protein M422DRAFT_239376 [Sphaerobolus stellatus SS14]|nr:hypothetical protein M422DRAFT_239376 [Sphaerobolus stellatus SS14]